LGKKLSERNLILRPKKLNTKSKLIENINHCSTNFLNEVTNFKENEQDVKVWTGYGLLRTGSNGEFL
jgi:hypothetical protein